VADTDPYLWWQRISIVALGVMAFKNRPKPGPRLAGRSDFEWQEAFKRFSIKPASAHEGQLLEAAGQIGPGWSLILTMPDAEWTAFRAWLRPEEQAIELGAEQLDGQTWAVYDGLIDQAVAEAAGMPINSFSGYGCTGFGCAGCGGTCCL
jgi:hypothetical protein